jgi:hypothetical protein
LLVRADLVWRLQRHERRDLQAVHLSAGAVRGPALQRHSRRSVQALLNLPRRDYCGGRLQCHDRYSLQAVPMLLWAHLVWRLQRHDRRGMPPVRLSAGEVLDPALQHHRQCDLCELHSLCSWILPDPPVHRRGQHRLPGLHSLRHRAVRESGVWPGLGHGVLHLQRVRGRTVHRCRVPAQRGHSVLVVWILRSWILPDITMHVQCAANVCCMPNFLSVRVLPEQRRELQLHARVPVPAVLAGGVLPVHRVRMQCHGRHGAEGLHPVLPVADPVHLDLLHRHVRAHGHCLRAVFGL